VVYIHLAQQILDDLAAAPQPDVEAEVRAGLGRALRLDERFQDAVTELRIASHLAVETGQPSLQTASLADLARASFNLGDFSSCLAACNEALALPIVAGNSDRSWPFFNIIAAVQLKKGDFDAAIKTSSTALEDRRKVGDKPAEAILLNNIGVAHMYLGDHDSALEFFHQARVIKTEIGETSGVADMLANIGDIKQLQGHPNEAIEIHTEALEMRRAEGGELRIAMSHRSLAVAYHAAGRESEALTQTNEALRRYRELDAKAEMVFILAVRAEILAATGRVSEAINIASESLELARELEMKGDEVVALDAMVVAQAAAGNYKSAMGFQTQARVLQNQLVIDGVRHEFAEFQAGFAAQERQTEIELLRKTNQLQDLNLRHQRLWRNSLIAGLVLLIVLGSAGWYGFLAKRREIRDRKRADSELLQSMESHRRLFDRNLAGIVRTDLKGRIQTTNHAFATMLGYSDTDEMSGHPILEFAADPSEIRDFFRELVDRREISNHELTLANREGEPVSILVNAGLVTDPVEDTKIIEAVAVDISDRKRAEEDRRRMELDQLQSQKLESLGVLAGGIAHDFNNTLMAILSNISLAKQPSSGSEETLKRLNEAEDACLRATSLTQQLLTFSRGGRPIRKTATIGTLVEEASTFVARGGNCSIDCRVASDLWPVEIDEGQMDQVVQNLVLNSIEAMPLGGIITVTTNNIHLAEGDVPTLEPGRYVGVEVSDTGSGIAEDELERVFDPFFTTKQGQSGLGLATAFSIIRSHGGAIVARSTKDQGSKFSVVLPASEEKRVETSTPFTQAASGHGALLIMDDDEAVRSAAAELLETIGYEVATASDGSQAIALYTEAMDTGRRFDAVILDLTVPQGVGGRETMARLLEIDPDVRAIVSSGYSTDPVMANYREHGFSGVAVKPYRLAELATTLQNAIKGRRDG